MHSYIVCASKGKEVKEKRNNQPEEKDSLRYGLRTLFYYPQKLEGLFRLLKKNQSLRIFWTFFKLSSPSLISMFNWLSIL